MTENLTIFKRFVDTVEAILNGGYFKALVDSNYRVEVKLPVTPFRDIFDNSSIATGTQFRNKLNVMLRKLDNALAEESFEKAMRHIERTIR